MEAVLTGIYFFTLEFKIIFTFCRQLMEDNRKNHAQAVSSIKVIFIGIISTAKGKLFFSTLMQGRINRRLRVSPLISTNLL